VPAAIIARHRTRDLMLHHVLMRGASRNPSDSPFVGKFSGYKFNG
jgi:hypothetical protein